MVGTIIGNFLIIRPSHNRKHSTRREKNEFESFLSSVKHQMLPMTGPNLEERAEHKYKKLVYMDKTWKNCDHPTKIE